MLSSSQPQSTPKPLQQTRVELPSQQKSVSEENLMQALNHLSDDFAGTTLQSSEQQKTLVYGIDCGRGHLLLGNDIACEVVSDGACCPLPNAPQALVGLHVSRGDLIPVYSIHSRLQELYPKASVPALQPVSKGNSLSGSLKDSVDIYALILLLGKGEDRVGIVLDQLPKLYDLTGQEPVSTKAHFSDCISQFTHETYHVENQWWLAFDWLAFLKMLADVDDR